MDVAFDRTSVLLWRSGANVAERAAAAPAGRRAIGEGELNVLTPGMQSRERANVAIVRRDVYVLTLDSHVWSLAFLCVVVKESFLCRLHLL